MLHINANIHLHIYLYPVVVSLMIPIHFKVLISAYTRLKLVKKSFPEKHNIGISYCHLLFMIRFVMILTVWYF